MRSRTRSTVALATVTIPASAGLAGLAGPASAARSTLAPGTSFTNPVTFTLTVTVVPHS